MSTEIKDNNLHQKTSAAEFTNLPLYRSLRVLLVDYHAIACADLRELIDNQPGFTIVGEACNCSDAVAIASHSRPDIMLIRLLADSEGEFIWIPRLLAVSEQSRVLILMGSNDAEIHRKAVQHGAMGLVYKDHTPETLIEILEKANSDDTWLVPMAIAETSYPDKKGRVAPEAAQIASLTEREREIIVNVVQGCKNKQIAGRLCISDITVRQHLKSIFGKLGVANRFELIIYAYLHGLAGMPSQ